MTAVAQDDEYPLRPSHDSDRSYDFADEETSHGNRLKHKQGAVSSHALADIISGFAALVLPVSIVRVSRRMGRWAQGARQPRSFSVKPWAASVQAKPQAVADRVTIVSGVNWLIIWTLLYGILFITIVARSDSACEVPAYGRPLRLSCIDRFWRGSSDCGIDGNQCRPFHDKPMAFRCPGTCETVKVLEPYAIGGISINYQSLIIGGSGNDTYSHIYRADSLICPAAIHAGVISAHTGGAGVVRLLGESSNFTGTLSNGLQAVDFGPSFPMSYTFDESVDTYGRCTDPRWTLITITALYGAIVSLCSASARAFYATVFVSTYFCVALAADAPEPHQFNTVISLAFRGFLPAAFVGIVMYQYAIKHTLENMRAPFDRTILWLGPFWVGALDNLTLELLPLQRLTPHDLLQPGAIITLVAILFVIFLAAIGQVWAFRVEGRLVKYLKFYAFLAALILGLMLIPGLSLRIHHYIIGLLLLPGTAIESRPSLMYQGILVGLFVNGVARWGFDSVLQTSADMFATDLDALIPQISEPLINGNNITFMWSAISAGYDAISVLVNDVERYRGYEDHTADSFSWIREAQNQDTFFRFGYVRYGQLQASSVGAYSNPGTWLVNGSWIPIDPEKRW